MNWDASTFVSLTGQKPSFFSIPTRCYQMNSCCSLWVRKQDNTWNIASFLSIYYTWQLICISCHIDKVKLVLFLLVVLTDIFIAVVIANFLFMASLMYTHLIILTYQNDNYGMTSMLTHNVTYHVTANIHTYDVSEIQSKTLKKKE